MNSYFYELSAKGRIKEWHEEADQARRVRLVKARKRAGGRRRARLTQVPVPRNLPTAQVLDDPARG